MKKLLGVLLSCLIIYSIYFDLSVGTLPQTNTKRVEAVAKPETRTNTSIPHFEERVEAGDTLISIVEHQIKRQLPVPISRLIHDFETLNPGQSADKIQIGKNYRFPDYKK